MFSFNAGLFPRSWSALGLMGWLFLNAGCFSILEAAPPRRALPDDGDDRMAFWTGQPRHGANCMNEVPPSADYFRAARAMGIEWMRLACDKWKPAGRDFLLGDADRYRGLVQADLATLMATLDRAHAEGMKIVLVPLSLPGMRWSQNNGGRFDGRIWRDARWRSQAARFWRDLAVALKDHPAVVAYNLLNEPAPEKGAGVAEQATADQLWGWYATVRGTARDLPAFYGLMVEARRSHWAFYSFRESYDGYDYELGAGKLPWTYWRAKENGQPFPLNRGANPVFAPIQRRLLKCQE